MNNPDFAKFQKERGKEIAGKKWDVIADGDTATVRVPGKPGEIKNVTFTFQQTDDFLAKISGMTESQIKYYIQDHLLYVASHDKHDKGAKGKYGGGEGQTAVAFVSDESIARQAGVEKLKVIGARNAAAHAIAQYFWTRSRNR